MPFLNRLADAIPSFRIAFDYFAVDLQNRELETDADLERIEGVERAMGASFPTGFPGLGRIRTGRRRSRSPSPVRSRDWPKNTNWPTWWPHIPRTGARHSSSTGIVSWKGRSGPSAHHSEPRRRHRFPRFSASDQHRIHLHVDGLPQARFYWGSFFFRHAAWTAEEMREPVLQVAEGTVYYYFSKYGDGSFTG